MNYIIAYEFLNLNLGAVMHGRISRYSMITGSGVVTNYSKKIFELRKEQWHDRKMLPAAGLYVECRLDANGFIVDAHSSIYQEFGENSLIKEIDFWKTETDEELKAKEQDLRNEIAEDIFKKTNYLEITHIDISMSITECLQEYFTSESSTIKTALVDIEEIPLDSQLQYLIVRRFLTKAIDYLIYCDKNVTPDMFASDLQKINSLEYSYRGFVQSANLKPDSIYTEVFLEKQLHYRGAIKAILGIKEKIIQLKNKVKFCINEMKKLRNQIEINKKEAQVLTQKLETQKKIATKAEEEIKVLSECQEKLEMLTKTFKESHFQEFGEELKRIHADLFDKTKSTLNLVCSNLDNKMWKIAMASTAVHNNFFKHDINSPYCTMTFYGQYLKRLDKNKLADSEKMGYNYYHKYKKQNEKLFLIYTANAKLEMHIKLQIMSASKQYGVVVVKTDGEFYSQINAQSFEIGYIDPFIRGNPKQLIEDAQKTKLNKTTQFAVISKQQATSIYQKVH